jgi:PAS domain S-box-containing protein
MLRALWYVATRKNPTLRIGAVDMSCSFVVCDVTLNDCPIVYVSDNFEKLTGYSRHEILGQNCRFLQSPTGKVEAGSRREFVENGAVFNLKRAMDERREIQQGIINYRKGGRPFLNLLTMVFIPWDDTPEGEIKYCVGFQIDLVECPEAVSAAVEAATGETERNGIVSVGGKDLEVEVDYRRVEGVGPYIKTTPPPLPATSSSREADLESGQTISVDDVSGLIQQLDPGGPSSDWHRHAWDKMLLENADDLVHVLSLKGLFLYLSPACKRLLEYDVGDLVGNSLSSVCHPSDIVPVMRELKEVQVNVPVNLVFRIRRKHSGYMWFESHGTLLGEQGKGRRCVMLVGRRRPVYALQRRDVDAHGGIGSADGEFWSKLSASGMFLFASSGVRSLLDLQPAELEGTSMHDLLRKESRDEFGRAVEKARRGAIVTLKHTLAHHRRGQPLQVQTTFYPGDASEPGQKNPSFLIAQTRAIKPPPRAIASSSAGGRSGGATEDAIMKGVITAEDSPAAPQPQDHQQLPTAATLEAEDDDNMFDELKTTRCTSWQYELRQMEKVNRLLAEELAQLMASKKKRKRRKRDGAGAGAAGGGGSAVVKDCANCHKRDTPEWRRGPSGNRDLCNSCGLRWAKQVCCLLSNLPLFNMGVTGIIYLANQGGS